MSQRVRAIKGRHLDLSGVIEMASALSWLENADRAVEAPLIAC